MKRFYQLTKNQLLCLVALVMICLLPGADSFAATSFGQQMTQQPPRQGKIRNNSFYHPRRWSEHCLSMGLMDDVGQFFKRFTTCATASHILIKGGAEAEFKLLDLKQEIADSPVAFAAAAAQYSDCPSAQSGGDLGSFGPGAMVKEFDNIVFREEVGKVHGPIKTQFGYHLIYIADRVE